MAKLTLTRFSILRRLMEGELLVMGMPGGIVYWADSRERCTKVARNMINEGLLKHPPAFASSFEVAISVSSKGIAAYQEGVRGGIAREID